MHWIGLVITAYLGVVLALFLLQRSLMYPAAREMPESALASAHDFEVVRVQSQADLVLNHWFRAPKEEGAPVVLFLHGNAGHIGHRVDKLQYPFDPNWGQLLVEYRGYGGNPGRPSEEGLIADALSALDWLEQIQGISPDKVILYGESLGGAVAVALAEQRAVAALILEAAPSSVAQVAQAHYWYVPAKWLVLDKWNSLSRIKKVSAPVFLMHGSADLTIPVRFGRALFNAANEPKTAIFPVGGSHVGLLSLPEVQEALKQFLQNLKQSPREDVEESGTLPAFMRG